MAEYPLPQAAARAQMDERSFRLLADRRVVFATPRTRTLGRGKQKLYETEEILIASILAPLLKLGANTFDLAAIADWLRRNSGGIEFESARKGKPVYIRLQYRGAENWGISIETASDPWVNLHSDSNEDHPLYLMATNPAGGNELAQEFLAIKLSDRIKRVEQDAFELFKQYFKPSQIVAEAAADLEKFQNSTLFSGHIQEEVNEFIALAHERAAEGDDWGGNGKATPVLITEKGEGDGG